MELGFLGGDGRCWLILREEEGQKAGKESHRAMKRGKKMLRLTCSEWFPWYSVGRRRLFACLPQAARVSAQGLQK